MYYTHRHFYVCEAPFANSWLVCEDGSSSCIRVATKYQAQFIRGLLLKWLCAHEYSRLIAVFSFLKYHPSYTLDWSVLRAKFVSIDKLPYSAI